MVLRAFKYKEILSAESIIMSVFLKNVFWKCAEMGIVSAREKLNRALAKLYSIIMWSSLLVSHFVQNWKYMLQQLYKRAGFKEIVEH